MTIVLTRNMRKKQEKEVPKGKLVGPLNVYKDEMLTIID
jgi:hypothetical protein